MSIGAVTTTYSPEELAGLLGQHLPTAEQSAIISSPLQPMLVIAGAGSGKTATMADRVVWLVANGLVRPDEILGVTFTRKAAGELAARIRAQLAKLDRKGLLPQEADDAAGLVEPKVSTYHSYANGLVSDYGLRLGIERDVVLLGTAQSWQLASHCVEAYDGPIEHLLASKSTLVNAVMQFAGECSEHLATPDQAAGYLAEEVDRIAALPYIDGSTKPAKQEVRKLLDRLRTRIIVANLAAGYNRAKRERGVLDFGDLVSLAARIAREVPQARQLERSRYKVVLLDEFQDTSHAQMVLFSELFGDGHAVTAVGDPNQSIYGFRGASAGQLFAFQEHFPLVGNDGRRAPAPAGFLTVAWRNSINILRMANRISAPLNREDPNRPRPGRISVPPLRPRPGATEGTVALGRYATEAEETLALADGIERARKTVFARDPETGRAEPVSTAVLCRRRAQIPGIAKALEERGIPYEIIGLAGLLAQPEIVDLVATLRVLADPGRSDALMRLLAGARWRIGPADLMALADWSRFLESRRRAAAAGEAAELDRDEAAGEAVVEQDLAEAASLIEALDRLPKPGWTSRHGRSLTPVALERLGRLAEEVRYLRSFVGDDLTLLLGEVERTMLLDIEVASKPGQSIHQARRNLDAFHDAAAAFMQTSQRVDLLAFLAWLEAAAAEEGGLDMAQVDVRHDAVQLLTVHASKGLEWDAVFVPGLNDGAFPSSSDNRWSSGHAALPWPLRGDRSDLPQWDTDQPDQLSWLNAEADYKSEVQAHGEDEERRLAYVAYTRAKHLLVCSSAGWTGSKVKPTAVSAFLAELHEMSQDEPTAVQVRHWVADEELGPENPFRAEVETAMWPFDPLEGPRVYRSGVPQRQRAGRRAAMEQAAQAVLESMEQDRQPAAGSAWAHEARLLLERHNAAPTAGEVELPAHISASLLVDLADDPDEVTRRLRRPVPRKPGMAARKGTAFHSWIEEYFGTTGMFDLEAYPDAADAYVDEAYELAGLVETFKASEWANRVPAAIEVPVETRVGGVVVRGRIDAVFRDADGSWDLIDWKTGTAPTGTQLSVKSVQLAVYRLAWARLHGIELDRVKAAFYYVGQDKLVRPHSLAGEAELEEAVLRAYA